VSASLRSSAFVSLVLAIAVAGIVLALVDGTASEPVSAGGIVPVVVEAAAPGGNVTCDQLGLPFTSGRIDVVAGALAEPPPDGVVLVLDPDGVAFAWTATFPLTAVIAKGSDAANVYAYDPAATSDAGLAAPPNAAGGPAELSSVTVCWTTLAEPSAWCSPGFWRQPQYAGAWEATGVDPDDRYSAWFGVEPPRTPLARSLGAPAGPTLIQVLRAPQWYGVMTTEAVADLLSSLHPAVPFRGIREADSCPLGREG